MSPRTGRPIKGESKKDKRLQLRLNDAEIELIDECADRLKTTRTDAVMRGVELLKLELDAKV